MEEVNSIMKMITFLKNLFDKKPSVSVDSTIDSEKEVNKHFDKNKNKFKSANNPTVVSGQSNLVGNSVVTNNYYTISKATSEAGNLSDEQTGIEARKRHNDEAIYNSIISVMSFSQMKEFMNHMLSGSSWPAHVNDSLFRFEEILAPVPEKSFCDQRLSELEKNLYSRYYLFIQQFVTESGPIGAPPFTYSLRNDGPQDYDLLHARIEKMRLLCAPVLEQYSQFIKYAREEKGFV